MCQGRRTWNVAGPHSPRQEQSAVGASAEKRYKALSIPRRAMCTFRSAVTGPMSFSSITLRPGVDVLQAQSKQS